VVATHLVERARGGDDDAFSELVGLTGDRCYAVAYRILRGVERAEVAARQAFLLAWRDLPGLRDAERFDVWLHRLLVNACYEEHRRKRPRSSPDRDSPVAEPGGSGTSVWTAERDRLERAFRRLSPERRAVLVLHHHVGMPMDAVAEVVGVPVGTVKSRLHYAIRLLRAAIAADDRTEAPEARPA
jgi:RNA polymerase sigma-70 factor (ECF subfamily)